MNEKKEFIKVLTPEFRVNFPKLFKPEGFQGQAPKFSVVMMFPKNIANEKDKKLWEAMKALANKVVKDKWPNGAPKGSLRNPFRDGDKEKPDQEAYANCIFITASCKQERKPGLFDVDKTPLLDEDAIYSGCYARATVSCYAYDNAGNRGVSFGLQNFMKTRDGERLMFRADPVSDFDEVETANIFSENKVKQEEEEDGLFS